MMFAKYGQAILTIHERSLDLPRFGGEVRIFIQGI